MHAAKSRQSHCNDAVTIGGPASAASGRICPFGLTVAPSASTIAISASMWPTARM